MKIPKNILGKEISKNHPLYGQTLSRHENATPANLTRSNTKMMLVIRKTMSANNTVEIKYSFIKDNLEQYTPEALAYMQAQRFFAEHCINESKQILGLEQFQTCKWLAGQHQGALNFLVSSFIMKEKLLSFDDLPLLSA